MREKKYYVPGFDTLSQLVETPASKEKTDKERFIINTVISAISAVAAVIAAVVSIVALAG